MFEPPHGQFPDAAALLTPRSRAERKIAAMYARLNGAPGAKVGELEPAQGTEGFVQRYESSAIYCRDGLPACWVLGAIFGRYVELGAEQSYLGFPATDELDWTDPDTQQTGRISHFERGAIAWTADDGEVVEFPARRVFNSGHIGVSSVGGWAELTLTSAGTFHFRGHLHNSGVVGLFCTVGAAIRIPDTDRAIGAKYEANVGGTTSIFDSRDEDWNESGFNAEIRANWGALSGAGSFSTTVDATLGGWEVVTLILLPILGAVSLISLLSGSSAPETHCEVTAGSHVLKDGNNNTIIEPNGVRCRPR
ncbi:hypothetical protein [Actinoplanes sp. NBRC 103695]|uniref:LGFP repeat-containing protein n=1 Tax=Actinoplanes sp. NBRC 103695 TaxID=3032202 RepID=UPI0024A3FEF2|nr:hypothetical protein [Actinoplanes sp. NBRC 103695]GLZ00436.1 hypothetical protein Acsp02_76880 [Actinoplanes sp. NBRC 103695]